MLDEVASALGNAEDFIREDGGARRKTETDGLGRGYGNIRSGLIGGGGFVRRVLALVASCDLDEVTVVVAHPDAADKHTITGRIKATRTSCGSRRPLTRPKQQNG